MQSEHDLSDSVQNWMYHSEVQVRFYHRNPLVKKDIKKEIRKEKNEDLMWVVHFAGGILYMWLYKRHFDNLTHACELWLMLISAESHKLNQLVGMFDFAP